MLDLLKLIKKNYVTTIIVIINIILFILIDKSMKQSFVLISTDQFELHTLYRFITSIFMHSNFKHLYSNMISLLFFGFTLEYFIGHKKFFIIYILSGIFANAATQLYYGTDSITISLGASGAIMGIIGAVSLDFAYENKMKNKLLYVIIFGIFIVFIAYKSTSNNIAHLVGYIGGFIIMYYLQYFKRRK